MSYFSERIEKTDLWTKLQNTEKTIVLYGMGDGADKILDVLYEKGISVGGVFASDGFVRDKVFRGFRLKRLSELEEEFGELLVLVSFATRLPDVMAHIYDISKKHELYAPDVPVFGDGLFDTRFFKTNESRFEAVYERLSDEKSKEVYINTINFKLTGDLKYLTASESDVSEAFENILRPASDEVYLDVGAYNGDTIKRFLEFSRGCRKIYAFEPDRRNFAKLCEYARSISFDCECFNEAAWDKECELPFFSRSGRNSAKTTSHKNSKETLIKAVRADGRMSQIPTIVKIDAEGSEGQVIGGIHKTIKSGAKLDIAAYHRNEDLFAIVERVLAINDGYKVYIRHFPYIPSWDTDFYFVKEAQN